MIPRRSLLLAPFPLAARAATVQNRTLHAFDAHIRRREAQIRATRLDGPRFLWLEDAPSRLDRVHGGEVAIEKSAKVNPIEIPGGLIHDWTGGVLIPRTTTAEVLALVQNYDRHKTVYQPEVADSKLLSRSGDDFVVSLRLVKKKVITVVLNTEHEVRYYNPSPGRSHSRSYSRKIAEVASPGTPEEHELAPGEGHGFLWKLYSYWRFDQRPAGVYVECEAISLTRGIPLGLGWMIEPVVRELPYESLQRTLSATRGALKRPA
jgi:hypothetical protein